MQIIIYETTEGGVGIITPTVFNDLPATARQVVPTGRPFWIREDVDLPPSDVLDSARRIDRTVLGSPDGEGDNQ
jgi:hypothetical protein